MRGLERGLAEVVALLLGLEPDEEEEGAFGVGEVLAGEVSTLA